MVSLGTAAYFTLLRHAAAIVGNSSSGIIEAASFELPVVDIGIRQRGRDRGANVVHCEAEAAGIAHAIARATSAEFRRSIAGMRNPYGDGKAAERIVDVLRRVPLDQSLIVKEFFDLPAAAMVAEAVR
jgi:UDP-N-acetylglucosamine 2-epimerase